MRTPRKSDDGGSGGDARSIRKSAGSRSRSRIKTKPSGMGLFASTLSMRRASRAKTAMSHLGSTWNWWCAPLRRAQITSEASSSLTRRSPSWLARRSPSSKGCACRQCWVPSCARSASSPGHTSQKSRAQRCTTLPSMIISTASAACPWHSPALRAVGSGSRGSPPPHRAKREACSIAHLPPPGAGPTCGSAPHAQR